MTAKEMQAAFEALKAEKAALEAKLAAALSKGRRPAVMLQGNPKVINGETIPNDYLSYYPFGQGGGMPISMAGEAWLALFKDAQKWQAEVEAIMASSSYPSEAQRATLRQARREAGKDRRAAWKASQALPTGTT